MSNYSVFDYEYWLNLPYATLIGSRAFDVHDPKSDYDICVWADHVPDTLPDNFRRVDIRNYFNVLPLNNVELVRMTKYGVPGLDIIVYDTLEDLNIVKTAVQELSLLNKTVLSNKLLRCSIFEHTLQHFGFEPATGYDPSKDQGSYDEDMDVPF